jgi:hypothetical protein
MAPVRKKKLLVVFVKFPYPKAAAKSLALGRWDQIRLMRRCLPSRGPTRVPLEMSDAAGKPVQMIPIIGIEDTHEIAIFRQLETAGQSGVGSLIRLYDQMNSRIFDGANDFDGVIPGTVVDNYQPLRWKGLAENGTNGFVDKITVIVGRDNAGDFLVHS